MGNSGLKFFQNLAKGSSESIIFEEATEHVNMERNGESSYVFDSKEALYTSWRNIQKA